MQSTLKSNDIGYHKKLPMNIKVLKMPLVLSITDYYAFLELWHQSTCQKVLFLLSSRNYGVLLKAINVNLRLTIRLYNIIHVLGYYMFCEQQTF